jgi:hypothetical protein
MPRSASVSAGQEENQETPPTQDMLSAKRRWQSPPFLEKLLHNMGVKVVVTSHDAYLQHRGGPNAAGLRETVPSLGAQVRG